MNVTLKCVSVIKMSLVGGGIVPFREQEAGISSRKDASLLRSVKRME